MLLVDRKSTRLNSSHTVIYTLSLHDALPIYPGQIGVHVGYRRNNVALRRLTLLCIGVAQGVDAVGRSEEHTSELQSHSDLHSFPTRRSSDLSGPNRCSCWIPPKQCRSAPPDVVVYRRCSGC